LEFHEITTQFPKAVNIAIPIGIAVPRIAYSPIKVYKLRKPSFSAGIVEHRIDSATVNVYDVEKMLCDCFRFRNRLGMDIVLEALKLYRERKPLKISSIMKYAHICKVEKNIRPYLEAII
jgi:predicted transcriptional regulator of viral defense system